MGKTEKTYLQTKPKANQTSGKRKEITVDREQTKVKDPYSIQIFEPFLPCHAQDKYAVRLAGEGFENYLQNAYIPMGVATSRYI